MNGDVPRTSEGRALTRQEQLLLLIEQRTETDDFGKLQRYYIPRYDVEYITIGRDLCDIGHVSGSDAASLKALERKGWIERPSGAAADYSYQITEDGKLKAQEIA
jgi:hypothetical protein